MSDQSSKGNGELYEKAKELVKAKEITIAEAVTQLIETGGDQPSGCEMGQFRRVLEERGLTPPSRLDWVWGIADLLPADILASTKLEPYAEARQEAKLRCDLGHELYTKMFNELYSKILKETVSV